MCLMYIMVVILFLCMLQIWKAPILLIMAASVSMAADPAHYMREMLQFVARHRWVWDVQMTKFFAQRWWELFPKEVGQAASSEQGG